MHANGPPAEVRISARDVPVREHRDPLRPVASANCPSSSRMAVSVPPTRPGKRVRRLTPTCSAAVGRGGADPSVTVPAMREERSRPRAELRRPLTARTAVVTASSQVVGRVTTLLLTVAGTAVVTRAVGENGFADWGTVLMVTAMFAFLLDPGFAPVVVRRLAEGGDEAPSPAALLRVRLVFSAIAFALVVALVVALRGTAPIVLAVVLAAQLFPRAVVMNAGPGFRPSTGCTCRPSTRRSPLAPGSSCS